MLFLLFLLSSGLFLTTLTVNGIPGEKQRQPGTRLRQQVRRRGGTQGVDTRLCKKGKLKTKDSQKKEPSLVSLSTPPCLSRLPHSHTAARYSLLENIRTGLNQGRKGPAPSTGSWPAIGQLKLHIGILLAGVNVSLSKTNL